MFFCFLIVVPRFLCLLIGCCRAALGLHQWINDFVDKRLAQYMVFDSMNTESDGDLDIMNAGEMTIINHDDCEKLLRESQHTQELHLIWLDLLQ